MKEWNREKEREKKDQDSGLSPTPKVAQFACVECVKQVILTLKGVINTKCIQQQHLNCSVFLFVCLISSSMHVMNFNYCMNISAVLNPCTEQYHTGDAIASFPQLSRWFSRCTTFYFQLRCGKKFPTLHTVWIEQNREIVLSLMDGTQGEWSPPHLPCQKYPLLRSKTNPKHLHILKCSQCTERFNWQKLAVGKWHGWAWLKRLPAALIRSTIHPSEENIYRTRGGEVEKEWGNPLKPSHHWWSMTEVNTQRGLAWG